MRREDLKNWTRDMLKDRIIELGGIIEQWKRDNDKMLQIMNKTQKENDGLKAENTAIRQHIKDLEDVCDGICFSDYEDLPFGGDEDEKDALIAKLQDQHQQDCIRYNDMRTAYLVTLDELAKLRDQFGVGK